MTNKDPHYWTWSEPGMVRKRLARRGRMLTLDMIRMHAARAVATKNHKAACRWYRELMALGDPMPYRTYLIAVGAIRQAAKELTWSMGDVRMAEEEFHRRVEAKQETVPQFTVPQPIQRTEYTAMARTIESHIRGTPNVHAVEGLDSAIHAYTIISDAFGVLGLIEAAIARGSKGMLKEAVRFFGRKPLDSELARLEATLAAA